jgi:ribosome-binding protein aMBF1 (putative translation factor)
MNRKLKARIIEKFGSQWEFAKAIEEHESTVSRVIRGRQSLSENERRKWATALNIKEPEKIFPEESY